jgi:hypothetical protein
MHRLRRRRNFLQLGKPFNGPVDSAMTKQRANAAPIKKLARFASLAAVFGLLALILAPGAMLPAYGDSHFSASAGGAEASANKCGMSEKGGAPAKDHHHKSCCILCKANEHRGSKSLYLHICSPRAPLLTFRSAVLISWQDSDCRPHNLLRRRNGWLSRAPPPFS